MPDINYCMVIIWEALLFLVTYGVASPFANVAIIVNIFSQTRLLKMTICRYFNAQFAGKKNIQDVSFDSDHLERICSLTRSNIHVMIWPGLALTSVIMSFFVIDMVNVLFYLQ